VESPNTIIQIPKAKIVLIVLFLHFTQGNIGCDNHSQSPLQPGCSKTKSFGPTLRCLVRKLVATLWLHQKKEETMSRVIAPKNSLLLFIPGQTCITGSPILDLNWFFSICDS
jgi:hypothetical protein